MSKGIKAYSEGFFIGFTQQNYRQKDGNIKNVIKVKFLDVESKTEIESQFGGELEEFLKLGLTEFKTYMFNMEFYTWTTQEKRKLWTNRVTSISTIE